MTRIFASIFTTLTLSGLVVQPVNGQCANLKPQFAPVMAPGYHSSLIANGLGGPRDIVIDTAGNLLVVDQNTGDVKRLTLIERQGSVCVKSNNTLFSGETEAHGIALTKDGRTLFVSTPTTVTAYSYDPVVGTAKNGKAVINNMPPDGHIARALMASGHSPDTLLVTVGSAENVDPATVTQASGRSMIKAYSIKSILAKPVNYNSSGTVLGWGLRNLVGISEDPVYGGIWSVENSMDDIMFSGKDVHNNNPAEKANYHGVLRDTRNSYMGKNYGYPSCVATWDPSSFGDNSSLAVGTMFSPDGVPPASDCAKRQQARLFFPAHTAPMDIKFTSDSKTAYISFHGSWDRDPPDGYRVMKVAYGRDGQPVAKSSSNNAAVTIMSNPDLTKCPDGCFRPVGLAFDKRGRLYVASDSTGEIFVVYGA